MKRLCVLVAAALMLSALSAAPAAADDDWVLDALDTVLEETILLTEAGAFAADPVLQTFVDEYGWGFGPTERAELLDELYWYDDYGVAIYPGAPSGLSPEATGAMQMLDPSIRSTLDANSVTAFLDHNPYLDAISDLLIRRGEAPSGARDPADRDTLELFVLDYANSDSFSLETYAGPSPSATTTIPPTTAPTTTVAPTTAPPTTVATTAATTTTTTPPTTATTVATTRADRTSQTTQATTTTLTVDEAEGSQGGAGGEGSVPDDASTDDSPASEGSVGGADGSAPTTDSSVAPDNLPFTPDDEEALGGAGAGAIGDQAGGSSATSLTSVRIGLVLVVLLAALLFVARARGRHRGGPVQLLGIAEVSSKLADCTNRNDVIQTAVAEAVRLGGADAGAYHQFAQDGLQLIATSDASTFPVAALTTGALNQVAKHGRPIRSVVESDPGLVEGPIAILAAPVLDTGRVIGVLTVARDASVPFEPGADEYSAAMSQLLSSALQKTMELESARQGSEIDWLTSLPNRRKFDRDVTDIGTQAELVGVAMVDIDHFKGFNDTYGHDTGDAVLKAVAEALANNVRPVDVAYRYGGEEFSVLLRGCELETAAEVMERVRIGVQQMVLPETPGVRLEGGTSVTVSVGVAAGRVNDLANLLRMADQAMYAAKRGGRNRVVVATPTRQD